MSEQQTGREGKASQPLVEVAIACLLVASVFLVMFAYTGSWPPLVVVESRSMQHSETESQIGVMDTGDLAMVKQVSSVEGIRTYVSGVQDGYMTYGDFGDVLIYWKGGDRSYTPIIHRAVIYLEANDNGSYSAPELKGLTRGPGYDYDLADGNSWDYLTGDIRLHGYGYRGMEVVVPIAGMLDYMRSHGIAVHDGFVTKGDFNPAVDQRMFLDVREPVPFEWVHGVATGEIPWFGILKLWLTGTLPEDTPANSFTFLAACIGVIAAIPISGEVYVWQQERRAKRRAAETPDSGSEKKTEADEPAEKLATETPDEKK